MTDLMSQVISVEELFGKKSVSVSEIRIKLCRKTSVPFSESSPETFATLEKKIIPFVFGEPNTSLKERKKDNCVFEKPIATRKFENVIPFPKILGNLNFQLKNSNSVKKSIK